jgi:hypothetical protein
MGDWFQIIVDKDATEQEAAELASRIRDWLIAEGIVEREMTDCVLGSDLGYPPGPNAEQAVDDEPMDDVRELLRDGLDIITKRSVFHAMPGEVELICTDCGQRFDPPDEWQEAIGEWYDERGPGNLKCPHCGVERPIIAWEHDPVWGFGYLGFEFWNWPPLRKSFVEEVSKRLGHRVVLVEGKL